MQFKFAIGEAVEYSPMGRSAGRYTVTRHQPVEDSDGTRRYRVKSSNEGYERTVAEHDLTSTYVADSGYKDVSERSWMDK